MDELVTSRGMGLILISHNLHLVVSFCDRVLVMYAGQIVEVCDAGRLHEARHPYTRGLLAALPELGHRRAELPQLQRDPEWLIDLPAAVGAAADRARGRLRHLRRRRHAGPRRPRRSPFAFRPATRWAWSANPAPANPPCCAPSPA